jgi:hypothetical protein
VRVEWKVDAAGRGVACFDSIAGLGSGCCSDLVYGLGVGRCGFFLVQCGKVCAISALLCCGVGWKSRDGEGVLEKGRIGGYLKVGYFSTAFWGRLGVGRWRSLFFCCGSVVILGIGFTCL